MNFRDPADWTFPVPIAYGPGRLGEIGAACTRAGMSRPLVVTDRGSAALPFIATIRRALAASGLSSEVFSAISPNPRDTEIAAGREAYRAGGHDGILAVGGGSGLDGAKAVCLTAANEIDLWSFDFDLPAPDMTGQPPFPPLVTVPTTSGTGAETESTAMITHTGRGMKLCVWHPQLKPALCLLDPEVTLALPRNLTAWTGCDALTHAIEAYSVPAFHPMCDGIALEALGMIARALPRAVAAPDDIDARAAMMVGSCLAGVSFLKGLGLVHAISHMVGAEFDTHHGLTNAILLPGVLDFNGPSLGDKAAAMARAMGAEEASAPGLRKAVAGLLDRLEIPRTLAEIGVTEDRAEAIAAKAIRDVAASTNPRPATVAEIGTILRTAITSGR